MSHTAASAHAMTLPIHGLERLPNTEWNVGACWHTHVCIVCLSVHTKPTALMGGVAAGLLGEGEALAGCLAGPHTLLLLPDSPPHPASSIHALGGNAKSASLDKQLHLAVLLMCIGYSAYEMCTVLA